MSFTPAGASLTTSAMHNNPFALLDVTVRDSRRTIVEQAEQQSLVHDADLCQQARSTLTNPKNRVAAEMAWLPGVSPERAARLLDNLLASPASVRREKSLPTLAHCNLMAAAFGTITTSWTAESLAEFILEFATLVDECDLKQITAEINDDRMDSGFPAIVSGDLVEDEFNARKRYFNGAIKEALNHQPSENILLTLTLTARYATAEGNIAAPELINELLDAYVIEIQGVLEKEADNAGRIIALIRQETAFGEASLAPLINALEKVVKNWDKLARPVQLAAKARGINHDKSVELAWSVRELKLELFNQHDMLNAATRLTEIEGEVFSQLPQFIEKVKEDEEALSEFHAARAEEEKKDAEWERSITYSATVGRIFKDQLSISPSGINWDGEHFTLEEITEVRWGATRHSVNGVPTGTTYTIGLGRNFSGTTSAGRLTITLKEETIYSAFLAALWRAVCVRLMIQMMKALDAGEKLTIGNILVDDAGVTLFKHKLFGSAERVRLSWFDVVVSSADGEFIVRSKMDKKIYAKASYQEHWNTHLLEYIIRSAFEKGVRNLSDYLKN